MLCYLPQNADQQCEKQDASQDGYDEDPPRDGVLVNKTWFRIDHDRNLMNE